MPTLEEVSLLAEVGVRIADKGGIEVVGVPVSTDEFAIESATGIVREREAEQLARMVPRMPEKQATNLNSHRLYSAPNGVCRVGDGPEAVPANLSTGR